MNLTEKIHQHPTLSPFRKKVLTALLLIPKGKVTSYKELSKHLNCRSAQAIGQALKHNPLAPEVPCHRVISNDLSIGGFMGRRNGDAIDRKIQLLASEGIQFSSEGKLINSELFSFSKL